MRVLITGGFGYLGGRVAQYLVDEGHSVILGSRKRRVSPAWLVGTESVRIDWLNEESLYNACKESEVVIHAAGMNAQECAQDPVSALDFNGLATARLVRASRKANVSKFIYFSTAHVYRSPLVGKISESTCPENCHPYATSHLAGENAVLYELANSEYLKGVILRLSNAVGAPAYKEADCWMLFVNNLCRQLVTQGEITVRSDPSIQRDFFPISKLCVVIDSIIRDDDLQINVANLSSGMSYSLETLASMIVDRSISTLDCSPRVTYECSPKNRNSNPLYMCSDQLENYMLKSYSSLYDEIDSLLLNCKQWFSR